MALKNVRRYDANGRELTEKDLETFRLDSPVVREILANLNRCLLYTSDAADD